MAYKEDKAMAKTSEDYANYMKNVKYRYMSLATFLLTVGYVFVLGITSEETVFKILSFLVLGAALVIISVVYSKNRIKSSKGKESET